MNPILESLQDSTGGTSSTRVALLIVVFGVTLVWGAVAVMGALTAYESKAPYAVPDIPWGVVTLIGSLATAKVFQRKIEEGSGDIPAPATGN